MFGIVAAIDRLTEAHHTRIRQECDLVERRDATDDERYRAQRRANRLRDAEDAARWERLQEQMSAADERMRVTLQAAEAAMQARFDEGFLLGFDKGRAEAALDVRAEDVEVFAGSDAEVVAVEDLADDTTPRCGAHNVVHAEHCELSRGHDGWHIGPKVTWADTRCDSVYVDEYERIPCAGRIGHGGQHWANSLINGSDVLWRDVPQEACDSPCGDEDIATLRPCELATAHDGNHRATLKDGYVRWSTARPAPVPQEAEPVGPLPVLSEDDGKCGPGCEHNPDGGNHPVVPS